MVFPRQEGYERCYRVETKLTGKVSRSLETALVEISYFPDLMGGNTSALCVAFITHTCGSVGKRLSVRAAHNKLCPARCIYVYE